MKKEYIKFPKSWVDLMGNIPEDEKDKLIAKIVRYYLYDEMPLGLGGYEAVFEHIVKPSVDFCKNAVSYGGKGGAPIGNQNARKRQQAEKIVKTEQVPEVIEEQQEVVVEVMTAPSTLPVKTPSVKKTLEERCLEFRNSLMPFLSEYGKEMITEFYNYWTEPNPSKTKMRFEMEKTWDTARRLETWLKRSLGFNKSNKGKSLSEETEDVVMSAMVELYKRGEITLQELQKERKQLIN